MVLEVPTETVEQRLIMNIHLIALAVVLALFTSSAIARDVPEMPELVNETATGNYILSKSIWTF